MEKSTYRPVQDFDYEAVHALLNMPAPAGQSDEEAERFERCKEMYLSEIVAECGPQVLERGSHFTWTDKSIGNAPWRGQSEEYWIRTGC